MDGLEYGELVFGVLARARRSELDDGEREAGSRDGMVQVAGLRDSPPALLILRKPYLRQGWIVTQTRDSQPAARAQALGERGLGPVGRITLFYRQVVGELRKVVRYR